MEADFRTSDGRTITVASCSSAALPTEKRASRLRKLASGCVFWICMVLIGVLAIPSGILFGIIHLIVRAMNFIEGRIEMN